MSLVSVSSCRRGLWTRDEHGPATAGRHRVFVQKFVCSPTSTLGMRNWYVLARKTTVKQSRDTPRCLRVRRAWLSRGASGVRCPVRLVHGRSRVRCGSPVRSSNIDAESIVDSLMARVMRHGAGTTYRRRRGFRKGGPGALWRISRVLLVTKRLPKLRRFLAAVLSRGACIPKADIVLGDVMRDTSGHPSGGFKRRLGTLQKTSRSRDWLSLPPPQPLAAWRSKWQWWSTPRRAIPRGRDSR